MIREVAPRPVAELLSGLCGEGAPWNARFTAKHCAGRGVVGGGCRITTWAKAADAGGSKRKMGVLGTGERYRHCSAGLPHAASGVGQSRLEGSSSSRRPRPVHDRAARPRPPKHLRLFRRR